MFILYDFLYFYSFHIFFLFFFPQQNVEGLLSSRPECVDAGCSNRFFPSPHGTRNTVVIIIVLFLTIPLDIYICESRSNFFCRTSQRYLSQNGYGQCQLPFGSRSPKPPYHMKVERPSWVPKKVICSHPPLAAA